MPIDHDNRVIFIHIPKCAGTSIEVACGWTRGYERIGLEATATEPDFKCYFGGGLQHFTIREMAENGIAVDDYSKFAVIRDPFDRMVSHFLWRHYRFQSISKSVGELRKEFSRYMAAVARASSRVRVFQDPCDGYNGQVLPSGSEFDDDMLRHVIPQASYIYCRGLLGVDRLFDFAQLSDCEPDLHELLPHMAPLQLRMKSGASFRYDELYDEVTRLAISELYAEDIRLYETVNRRDVSGSRSPEVGQLTRRPREAVLPRRIWMYWHQGWSNAPFLVRECLKSWLARNSGWELVLLDRATLGDYVQLPSYVQTLPDIPHASLSDIVRILLLERFGGIWVDATVYCNRPLDEWIDDAAREGFFAFERPTPERPVASWFLAAHRGSYLVRRWKEETLRLWQAGDFVAETRHLWPAWNPDLGDEIYFWFHMAFNRLLITDDIFRAMFQSVPKLSADGPHEIQWNGMLNALAAPLKVRVMSKAVPVYKLTYRLPENVPLDGTALGFLFGRG